MLNEQKRKTLIANLLGGLSPSAIAEAIDEQLEVVMDEIGGLVETWSRERVDTGELNAKRLDVAINAIWQKVMDGERGAIDDLVKLIASHKQDKFDALTLLEAESEKARKRQPPKDAKLWNSAAAGGFARSFADLLAADLDSDGSTSSPQAKTKLTPYQAFFCAWYPLYVRRGGKDFLKKNKLPHSIAACAGFLGVNRQTLYAWQASAWFNAVGARVQLDTAFLQMLPDALSRLHQNVWDDNGNVANKAIEMVLNGVGAGSPAVQLNVNQQQGIGFDLSDLTDEQFNILATIATGEKSD